ncbi:tyrosine-protein kinase Src64B [Trichonephila clavata]|uniref:Tyrosine-protein kinase n=1 Tax=Trichonephila clavata TaxID=2740835 RepID=A0A8X6F502_TRICU|nr:tyrosine-protein kinase Src64B [Trichonephila clavata]
MGICCHSKQSVQNDQVTVRLSDIREGETANKNILAVALYPLHSNNSVLLTFEKGDKLIIEDDSDPDWYLARHLNDQRRGFAPKSYLVQDIAGNPDWFFGDTNRADAERLLLQPQNEPGTFMVRDSHIQGSYALSIKELLPDTNEVIVRHYKIRTLDQGGFFISSSKTFSTLDELVAYYSVSADGLCRRLIRPCSRPRPAILGPLPNTRDKYEVPFESLQFIRTLGKGNFGEVFYGVWNGTVEVAIKQLISNGVHTDDFRREVAVMKAINHPKIVRLYAICTEKEPFCIIMEYLCNGNLQHYLKNSHGKQLKLPSLVNMAAQIADGMKYLEANNLIHRDLAARNILVGDGGIVKLADFGLARMMDEAVYVTSGGKLPIKWTAPEAYTTGQFTIKSDVWSYGIVLYEIFTHGGTPYQAMKNSQVSELITKHSYRMPKPSDPECSDAVYETMMKCWKKKPEDRPTFEYLHHYFTDYYVTSEAFYREA